MHIKTKKGWKLLGGPMKPAPKQARWWQFSQYNASHVLGASDPTSSMMNAALVRQFEAIAPMERD